MTELYNKYKNTSNPLIYECLLQWYLIKKEFRSAALITILNKDYEKSLLQFVKKHHISHYGGEDNTYPYYLLIFDPTQIDILSYDMNNLTYIEIAKLLGPFYTCASNTFTDKTHTERIVIEFNGVAIYAQQCTQKKLKNNLSISYKIFTELTVLFNNLDPSIFGDIIIYKISNK